MKFLCLAICLLFSQGLRAEITDNELRKLFIITDDGVTPFEYGGIVLFQNFFERKKNACSFKKLKPNTTIFVDQEGGSVIRIKEAAPPSAYDSTKCLRF